MHNFCYPAALTPERRGGGFVVAFRDVPEAITQGENLTDALLQAADCLEEAVAGRIRRGDVIPPPSRPAKGERMVPVPAVTTAKAALYVAIRQAKISKVQLAARLGCDEKQVRRLLDPRHASKLPQLQSALAALGKQIVIQVQDAA